MLTPLYLAQVWKGVGKVKVEVDETGSTEFGWSTFDLREKEGKVVLIAVVSHHDCSMKRRLVKCASTYMPMCTCTWIVRCTGVLIDFVCGTGDPLQKLWQYSRQRSFRA